MKKIINFLILIMVFCLSMTVIGCGEKDVKLKDFADKTVTVNCGDYYTLPSATVFDEDENFYRVTYSVKDKQGQAVSVSSNKFLVKNFGNGAYVVNCSAEVGEKTYTRKITLNVVDGAAPEFLSTAIEKCAAVNTEYNLDTAIQIKDNSGSYTVTYAVKDSENNPVTLTDGNKVTFTSEGNYTVTATAKDSANNQTSKDFTLQVRDENVVQDFKYESDMAYTQAVDFTATWVESYEGATGLVKISGANTYGYFSIKALCDLSTYSDCSHIVVRYFIPSTSTVSGSFFFGESGYSAFAPVVGEWATTVISYDLFNEGWSKGTLYSTAIAGTLSGEMYIDSVIGISATKATGNEYAPIRTVADVDYIDTYYSNKAYVESYQGATGVVEITLTGGDWGGFVVKPQQSASAFASAGYIAIRIYAEQAVSSIWFNNGDSDTYAPLTTTTITAGSWVEYLIKADTLNFNNNIRLSFNSTGKVYIDEVYVISKTTATGLEVAPIRTSADIVAISSYEYKSATFVDEYEGKQGVIKFDMANWAGFNFKAMQDASVFENSAYIIIRMYVVSDVDVGKFWVNNAVGSIVATVNNEWVDYVFPISAFNLAGNNCITAGSGNVDAPVTGDWTLYIDEIYAAGTMATGNEVVAIRDAYDTYSITNYTYKSASFVEEYEGKQGVVKVEMANWGAFAFKVLQNASAYESAAYVFVRMYVTASVAPGTFWVNSVTKSLTATETGKWVDYKFPASAFDFDGEDYICAGDGNASAPVTGDWTIYIDEIYVVTKTKATGAEVVPIRTLYDADAIEAYYSNVAFVENFNDATGVAEVTLDGGWGGFVIKPQQSASAYANAAYLVIKLYAEQNITEIYCNDTRTALFTTEITTTGSWVEYLINASEINFANGIQLSFNSTGKVYIDEVYVINKTAATGTEIVPIRTEADKTGIGSYYSNVVYVDSYNDATGVVEVTVTEAQGTWGGFVIKPQQVATAYEGTTKLVIRVYAEQDVTAIYYNNGTETLAPEASRTITAGSWVDYTLEIAFDYSKPITLSFKTTGKVYIDEVYAA